jgi:hypothetical protein
MPYQFEKKGTVKSMAAEQLAAADAANSYVIELDHGTLEDGTPYWAYIAVKPSKYEEFKRITAAHQPIVLADYGNILKYGFDQQVPDAVKEEMKREYAWDDNYLTTLANDVKKEQGVFIKKQEEMRITDIVAMLKQNPPNGSAPLPTNGSARPKVAANTVATKKTASDTNTVATKNAKAIKQTVVKKAVGQTTVNPKRSQLKPKSLWALILTK